MLILVKLGAKQSSVKKRRFSKLTEESVNERQKPLIFKSLTKVISLLKKLTVEHENETDLF